MAFSIGLMLIINYYLFFSASTPFDVGVYIISIHIPGLIRSLFFHQAETIKKKAGLTDYQLFVCHLF